MAGRSPGLPVRALVTRAHTRPLYNCFLQEGQSTTVTKNRLNSSAVSAPPPPSQADPRFRRVTLRPGSRQCCQGLENGGNLRRGRLVAISMPGLWLCRFLSPSLCEACSCSPERLLEADAPETCRKSAKAQGQLLLFCWWTTVVFTGHVLGTACPRDKSRARARQG